MKTISDSVLSTAFIQLRDDVNNSFDNQVHRPVLIVARDHFFLPVRDPVSRSVSVCVHYSIYEKIRTA